MDLASKVRDLEFLLRREKMESKTKVKEILYQILDVEEGLQRLLQIALRQDWPKEPKKFVEERFSLVGKKLLQLLERTGATRFNSLGEPVNEEYHEIIGKIPSDRARPGHVEKVEREGYMYKGDVLRMAQVVMAIEDQALS